MFKKKCKRNTLIPYKIDGLVNQGWALYPGGLITGTIYSLTNGWAYIWGGKLENVILRYLHSSNCARLTFASVSCRSLVTFQEL